MRRGYESLELRRRTKKSYFKSLCVFGIMMWPFAGIPAVLVMLVSSLLQNIFHWDWGGWNFVLFISAHQISWLLIIGSIGFHWFDEQKADQESERSRSVTLFYRADNAEAIIRDGFHDREVLVAGWPSKISPIAESRIALTEGKQLLAITLPGSLDISKYEVDFQKGRRWWCLPSEIINGQGVIEAVHEGIQNR
jgi:hypothetical protein